MFFHGGLPRKAISRFLVASSCRRHCALVEVFSLQTSVFTMTKHALSLDVLFNLILTTELLTTMSTRISSKIFELQIFSFHIDLEMNHGSYLVVFRSKLKCVLSKQLNHRFGSGVFSKRHPLRYFSFSSVF